MSDNLTTQDTIIDAWNMGVKSNAIKEELIFHSVPIAIGRGVQYASREFRKTIKSNALITQSMSRKGNCWDNAVAESFF